MAKPTTVHVSSKNLSKIKDLAEEAGREILRFYHGGGWTVTAKADDSPLTQADLAANAILLPGIEALGLAPVISEESPAEVLAHVREQSHNQSPTDSRTLFEQSFWLIDPLDGTKDFVAKLDTFVISIGLVQNRAPVFGLIHHPVSGETWWAQKNEGAFKSDGRRLMNDQTRSELIIAGSRTTKEERIQSLAKNFPLKEFRKIGSALKFCLLAEGVIDLYPRFGPTSEWDTAGGQIIAEEAGCQVISLLTGQTLSYAKPGLLNEGGFAAARGDLDLKPLLRI